MLVNTNSYEATHGRAPRGEGYWGFEITATDGKGAYITETRWAHGTPAAARKQACRALRDECGRAKLILEVTVLP